MTASRHASSRRPTSGPAATRAMMSRPFMARCFTVKAASSSKICSMRARSSSAASARGAQDGAWARASARLMSQRAANRSVRPPSRPSMRRTARALGGTTSSWARTRGGTSRRSQAGKGRRCMMPQTSDADGGMAVEMLHGPLVRLLEERRGRLAHVVEQRAPALQRLGRRALHHPGGVLEHIVYMVLRHLGAALHGHKLRQHEGQYIDAGHKRIVHIVAADEALQLVVDAFAGHLAQQVFAGDHGLPKGGRVDGHHRAVRRSAGSQDAQCVRGKARRRVSHAAQDAALHVGHAAEGIDDPARRVVS